MGRPNPMKRRKAARPNQRKTEGKPLNLSAFLRDQWKTEPCGTTAMHATAARLQQLLQQLLVCYPNYSAWTDTNPQAAPKLPVAPANNQDG
jgi:hypothetical protein